MLPDPSFDICCFCTLSLFLLSSAFVMMSQLSWWPSTWLNSRQPAVNPTNSLPLRDYIHHCSWSAKVIGIKNVEHLKCFLFLNIMATLSWLESPQNSCVSRTSEGELICKCGLCRCNKLKWGHTGLGWTLIQWLVSYKKKKHTSKENTM